ncbi:MAG: hypothetical protein V3S38_07510, partial [Acidimicrobiia bacterium]
MKTYRWSLRRQKSIDRASDRLGKIRRQLETNRSMFEERAVDRWGSRFSTQIHVRGGEFLGCENWVIADPAKYVVVTPDTPDIDFPVRLADIAPGSPTMVGVHSVTVTKFVHRITAGRYSTWSEYLLASNPRMFNGSTVAVSAVGDDGFLSTGFLEMEPSSYFEYLDSCTVLGVLDAFAVDLNSRSWWRRLWLGSVARAIETYLDEFDPQAFRQRSASIGLNVAVLIREEGGATEFD